MGRSIIDLTGMRFGRLTVLRREGTYVQPNGNKSPTWLCQCDCGNETVVRGYRLRSGNTQSCSCLQRESIADRFATHGQYNTRLYNIWRSMKARCHNPRYEYYHRYGGRGISVCDEWKSSFQAFYDWALSAGYAENLSIDRIDNDGNYCPENCRWATMQKQQNNKSTNRRFTINGETQTLAEWCRYYGKSRSTVKKRFRRGWSIEEALGLIPRKK